MRVRPLISLLAGAATLLTSGAAAAAPTVAQPVGRTTATLEACHDASDLASRYATFGAQVTTIPGASQMSIHFELDEHIPGEPGFRALTGVPGFDVWRTSDSGVGIFSAAQEVSSLVEPASYRVVVTYRWIGPRHRVLRRAKRTSSACSLPVGAPAGLVVGSLSRAPATVGG